MRISGLLLIAAALCGASSTTQAAGDYPTKPVHLVVGLPPGGGSDTMARLVAKKLSETWGQSVLVENRPGADGSVAADYVARAAADGYTIFLPSMNLTIPAEGYKPSYDPIKSFAPITLVANVPDVLVVNASTVPAKTVKEFVEYAKSKPGALNFGSGGIFQRLQMELLMHNTGIKMVNVNYNGGSPAMVAMLGGEVQSMFGSISAVKGQVLAGKARALAIGGDQHSPVIPDVPTFKEAGVGAVGVGWYGLVAPAGTPANIVQKIHDDTVKALQNPDVQKTMSDLGFFIVGNTPEEFHKVMQNDLKTWAGVMEDVNKKK